MIARQDREYYLHMDRDFDLQNDLAAKKQDLDETGWVFVFAKIVYQKLFLQLIPLPALQKEELHQGATLLFVDVCRSEVLLRNCLPQLLINDCNDRLDKEYKSLVISHLPGSKIGPSLAIAGLGGIPAPTSLSPKQELLQAISTDGGTSMPLFLTTKQKNLSSPGNQTACRTMTGQCQKLPRIVRTLRKVQS